MAAGEPFIPFIDVEEVPLDDFLAWEEEDFNQISKSADKSFKKIISDKLLGLKYKAEEVEELAPQILYEGMEIHECADEDSDLLQDVTSLQNNFLELYDRAHLLQYAPRGPTPNRPITLEQDQEARQLQYEHYCKLYPKIVTEPESNPALKQEVQTLPGMIAGIKAFIESHGKLSRKMIFVFNGHGGPQGLSLEKEEAPVPVDKVLQDIKDAVSESRSKQDPNTPQLPSAVEIVLAQCYSHCFVGPRQEGIIEVIPLTSEAIPETRFSVSWQKDGGRKIMKGSRHKQLEKYVQEVIAKEAGDKK